jgi:hypothetical protein
MSKDPLDHEDLEPTEFEASPEDEVSPELVADETIEPVGEDLLEPAEGAAPEPDEESSELPAEEDSAGAVDEEKPRKGKREKRERRKKTKERKDKESAGFAKLLQGAFPDVYSVMLVVAFLAIVIAIAILLIELSRYGFDIKGPGATASAVRDVAARTILV